MQYFDTHAHYYDSRFSEETEGGAYPLLDALFAGDVSGIVNVATSPQNYDETIAQAMRYPKMYTALGIHPSDCQYLEGKLDHYMAQLYTYLTTPENKVVALGEIGLDYHYDDTDQGRQFTFLHAQLELAEQLHLPVVIHDRDAHGDIMDILGQHPHVRGVMHSFSGSAEMAKILIRRDFYISFSGVITFKGARKTVEVAAMLPHDRVLIETDCPYLAPTPHRGKLNHSGHLVYTNQALASAMGISPEECATLTTQNAHTFFSLSE